MMAIYCQQDPRWADDHIGASGLTVRGYGCTLTCVAMLSTAWNNDNGQDPGEIASRDDWFTRPGDPQGEGLILWGKLNVHGLRFDGRVRMFDQAAVNSAASSANRAAIIEVQTPNYKHWVVAIRYVPVMGWRVADPLTGKYRWLPKDWKPIGFALFSRI